MEIGSELIGRLYGTAEDQHSWIPLLDDLRLRFDADSAVVQILRETPDRMDVMWQARDTRSTANSDLHDRCLNTADNPRLDKSILADLPAPMAAELLRIGTDHRFFHGHPALLAEMQRRLAQVGLGHAFWGSVPISEGQRITLIVHRKTGGAGDIDASEESALRELLPHMQRSARLGLSLEKASSSMSALENVIDRLDLALVLCDRDLRVQWCNSAAEEIVAGTMGLKIAAGRLQAGSAADAALLRRMVGVVAQGVVDSQVGIVTGDGDHPIHVRATRSPRSQFAAGSDGGGVALFLWQPSMGSHIDPTDLGALYELTPAEARLATALAGGASLSDYSKRRGIAVGTARNQLKRVLVKTCTRGQSELIRILCGSPASRIRLQSH